MKSSIGALSALLSVGTAQILETFAPGPTSTIDTNVPTSAASVSGPIETGEACAQIGQLVFEITVIEAELAYACLKSVPIDTDVALDTVALVKRMFEWHSTVDYLKDPPKGYTDKPVDLMKELDDIGNKVSNGDYDNEYDFEIDIARTVARVHDGHLTFSGFMHMGVFTWRRDRQIALISASEDGKKKPKVWGLGDFNQTGTDYEPSAISQIDGKDAADFIAEQALEQLYHDPDARYNSMFYMQPAENYGYFANPTYYPGPSNNITYENGTSQVFTNIAYITEPTSWVGITSGQDFYDTFVKPSSAGPRTAGSGSSSSVEKRSTHHQHVQRSQEHKRDAELNRRWTPWAYPTPVVDHTEGLVKLAGYFLDTGAGKVGALMIQTFQVESAPGMATEAIEFQAVIEEYIAQAKAQKVEKHIIDLRTNGGGKILLGYETFLQFFPNEEPQLQSRWRGHKGAEIFGEQMSSIQQMNRTNGNLYTSPFNFHSYIDKDGKNFTDFKDMYPPEKHNDDSFSALLKYNLSSPIETSDATYSLGIEMTGYMSRDNFTDPPFKAEDIILLTDGICASTCSLFTELMVQQAGVKTLAVGGLPSSRAMQAVGGTKGSMLIPDDYLIATSDVIIKNFASSDEEAAEWADVLPRDWPINVFSAGVNFQDNIRKGLEKEAVPTQFMNDSASCRIYYEPKMYFNVSALWSKAAEVAFGKDGGMDEDACVAGSVTTKEQQSGGGGNKPSGGNKGDSEDGEDGESGSGSGSGEGEGSGSGEGSGNGGDGSGDESAAGALRPAIFGLTAVVLGTMAFGAGLV